MRVEHVIIEGNCAEVWEDEKVETEDFEKIEEGYRDLVTELLGMLDESMERNEKMMKRLDESRAMFEGSLRTAEKAIGDRLRFEDLLLEAMRETRKGCTSFSEFPAWYGEAVELIREFRDEE